MDTLYIHPQNPQDRLISQIINHLDHGAVLLPTVFGYAIAIALHNKKIFEKLSTYINSTPYIICRDLSELSQWASLDDTAFASIRTTQKQDIPPVFELPTTKNTPKFLGKTSVHITTSSQPIHVALFDGLQSGFVILPINDDSRHSDYEMGESYGHLVDILVSVGEIETVEMAVERLV